MATYTNICCIWWVNIHYVFMRLVQARISVHLCWNNDPEWSLLAKENGAHCWTYDLCVAVVVTFLSPGPHRCCNITGSSCTCKSSLVFTWGWFEWNLFFYDALHNTTELNWTERIIKRFRRRARYTSSSNKKHVVWIACTFLKGSASHFLSRDGHTYQVLSLGQISGLLTYDFPWILKVPGDVRLR